MDNGTNQRKVNPEHQKQFDEAIKRYLERPKTYRDKKTSQRIGIRIFLSKLGYTPLIINLVLEKSYQAAKLAILSQGNKSKALGYFLIAILSTELIPLVVIANEPEQPETPEDNFSPIPLAVGNVLAVKPVNKIYLA